MAIMEHVIFLIKVSITLMHVKVNLSDYAQNIEIGICIFIDNLSSQAMTVTVYSIIFWYIDKRRDQGKKTAL